MQDLLNDFKLMAQNRNEKHEFRKRGDRFLHKDGWGVLLGESGKLVALYKKAIQCWSDPFYKELENVGADFVMIHARRASPSTPINCNFTHPFEREGWFFCHNGTIDCLKGSKIISDSERFFILMLEQMKYASTMQAVENTVIFLQKLECTYSSINSILSNGNKTYVLNRFQESTKYPQYYAMKFIRTEDYTIVSSEVLAHFGDNWEELRNGSIIELDTSSAEIRKHLLRHL